MAEGPIILAGVRFVALLSISFAVIVFQSPTLGAETARPADAFVDFVGVNTHLGYSDTTYADYEGIVKPRLLEQLESRARLQ